MVYFHEHVYFFNQSTPLNTPGSKLECSKKSGEKKETLQIYVSFHLCHKMAPNTHLYYDHSIRVHCNDLYLYCMFSE